MSQKSKRWKVSREKRDGGAFIALPLSVLNSGAYLRASARARMLMMDLCAQYRGDNNGDLAACWKFMKLRGWKSEATLHKAKQELQELGLILETRKGARPNKATLYALTWCELDICGGKLDISKVSFQRRLYKQFDSLPKIDARRFA